MITSPRRQRALGSAMAAAAIALLAGCAANVTRTDAPAAGGTAAAAPARIAVPAGTRNLHVMLVPGPKLQRDENWAALREEWITSLTAASGPQKITGLLVDAEPAAVPEGTVLARVLVNDYRYVSQAKRYGLGIFSGNAFLDLDIEFFAPPGKQPIGTRKFSTSSSAWQGVFSAMTPKQVEAVVGEIVREVGAK